MRLLALRITITAKAPEGALSNLIRSGIPFSRPAREENGLSFTCALPSKRRVLSWCKESGYDAKWEYEGVFTPILSLKHRPGIILGIFLSLFLIYLSTFYVWSVRIEGNSNISDERIVQLLWECGFGEGSLKRAIDVNEIQNTALARCHELSFLSINIHGAVADVVVHERVTSPQPQDSETPYNLVADCDGVVVSSLVLEGQNMFENGDTVFRGQLLVSGLVDSTNGNARLTHARGKVYARTNRTLTFTVPFRSTERLYADSLCLEGVRILGHSFYTQKPDDSRLYDQRLEEREIRVLGVLLPATRELWYIDYYTEEEVLLTPEEAEEKAYGEYERYISTELDSATITEELFTTQVSDSEFILTAEIKAIENIATEQKIEKTE